MTGFTFRLEHPGCSAAEPRTPRAAVPNWREGDRIHLGNGRTLRVVATRLDEGTDGDPVAVLVVEPA